MALHAAGGPLQRDVMALLGPGITTLGLSLSLPRRLQGKRDLETVNSGIKPPGFKSQHSHLLTLSVPLASHLPPCPWCSCLQKGKKWSSYLLELKHVRPGCRRMPGSWLNSPCGPNGWGGGQGEWAGRPHLSGVLSSGPSSCLSQLRLIRAEIASHWFLSPKDNDIRNTELMSLQLFFFPLIVKDKRGIKWLFSQLLYVPQGKSLMK